MPAKFHTDLEIYEANARPLSYQQSILKPSLFRSVLLLDDDLLYVAKNVGSVHLSF